jgi:SAM-dependent methyltransferase
MIPDWQLPDGVDRGLWDYLHSAEMVAGYDVQMQSSPLATEDVAFCERAFPTPGRLLDLGCGTGRLSLHFATKGYECLGVDLSPEMLQQAEANLVSRNQQVKASLRITFLKANLTDLSALADESFDYAACLFSTLGMVRGSDNRIKVLANAWRVLKPGGQFVVHVHNRYFLGLGYRRVFGQVCQSFFGEAGDITMPQAYPGAALTLHHFSKPEIHGLLHDRGFQIHDILAVGATGKAAWPVHRIYGYLVHAWKPLEPHPWLSARRVSSSK